LTSDDDRVAYLSGDSAGQIGAEDAASLDELRALLADTSVWEEPDPALEDQVVGAIPTGPVVRRHAQRRRVVVSLGVVAAALALAIGLAVSLRSPAGKALRFQGTLAATPLAPGAQGRVTLTQTNAGWHVDLHVSGLPRLDNGRFYEAWLKNPAGTLVPIGTFNQGPSVILWAGVSPQNFPTLTITKQTASNTEVSSGLRVLTGGLTQTSSRLRGTR
jgi:hypothetical protein